MLKFRPHRSTGIPSLSLADTSSLLEQLESALTQLAVMLTSRHVQPIRTEAAQWAGKLGAVAEVLQNWLSVQELWESMEAVLSSSTSPEARRLKSVAGWGSATCMSASDLWLQGMSEESAKFEQLSSEWGRVMEKSAAVKNCILVSAR